MPHFDPNKLTTAEQPLLIACLVVIIDSVMRLCPSYQRLRTASLHNTCLPHALQMPLLMMLEICCHSMIIEKSIFLQPVNNYKKNDFNIPSLMTTNCKTLPTVSSSCYNLWSTFTNTKSTNTINGIDDLIVAFH